MLVLLAQLPQGGQVLLVMGGILQSNGEGIWVDLGKGVVDLSQMLRRDLVRGEALVGRPSGVVAHRLSSGGICTLFRLRGGAQQQGRHTQDGQRGGGSSDEISQGKTLLFQMIVTKMRVSSRPILPERAAGLKAQMLGARPENSSAADPLESAAPALPVMALFIRRLSEAPPRSVGSLRAPESPGHSGRQSSPPAAPGPPPASA